MSRTRRFTALSLLLVATACTHEPDRTGKLYADVDGVKIRYLQAGQGDRTLLLLHGFGSGSFTWTGVLERTPPEFTAFAIDFPGFGYSDKPEDFAYGVPAFARAAVRFLDVMGRGPALVAGNSMGGAVAIWAAAEYPDRVAALVPVDAAGLHLSHETLPVTFRLIGNPTLGPILLRMSVRSLMRQTLKEVYADDTLLTKQRLDEYFAPTRFPGSGPAWHKAFVDLVSRTDRGEVAERMERVRQPVLLLWGAHDTWTPPKRIEEFRLHMPHASAKIYPHLGHVPQEEDPAAVAEDLFAFARSLHPPGQH